ncbi:glycerophosphoinositol permease [Histoplasma capsulatum var. duboisii H88]|uniref:Glycerophosphoinositol permease n=1 Tax=Ajellomyces capsulatus (strain H88) TaxID=544711 RepID=A0A8A1LVG4_AJEC8|nr:glycerophosphoinositol permease [Histoplasma capsulatum var. duboisii H88]
MSGEYPVTNNAAGSTEEKIFQKIIVPTVPDKLEDTTESRWERSWPVIAGGAGLFSDGYLNNIIGSVNTVLRILYPVAYTKSAAVKNVPSIAFAGTVVGQLLFGVISDHYSRKWSLMASTLVLIIFAALSAGSYGANGSVPGLFTALTIYRFFLGVGIGGEYPAGSVAAAESAGELKRGHRNRWFIMFTNVQINLGFVLAAFVPMVVVLVFTENHLRTAWRVMLGLGVLPPLSLLYLRMKLREPENFNRERMHKYPVKLIARFYWWRLFVVSLAWFAYDFSSYAFGIYSSVWLRIVLSDSAPLWKSFGWNTVINFFNLPGACLGAFISDWIGPRYALSIGVFLQGIVGFIMAGCYEFLATAKNVGAFVVLYGIFISLGEIGPGNNIGLIAAMTSATAVRGQYYGIAAAIGKIGAFVGTYAFPIIQARAPNPVRAGQDPFFVASTLCMMSAVVVRFLIPHIGQDTIALEDARFRRYLEENGYDTSKMGVSMKQKLQQLEQSQLQESAA